MISSIVDFDTIANSSRLVMARTISVGWSTESHSTSPVSETRTFLVLQLQDNKLVVTDKGMELQDLKESERIGIGGSTLETQ